MSPVEFNLRSALNILPPPSSVGNLNPALDPIHKPIQDSRACGVIGSPRRLPSPQSLPQPESQRIRQAVNLLSPQTSLPEIPHGDKNLSVDLRTQVMSTPCDTAHWLTLVDQYAQKLSLSPYGEVQSEWHALVDTLIARFAKGKNQQVGQCLRNIAQTVFQKETHSEGILNTHRNVVQLVNKIKKNNSQFALSATHKEKLLNHCIRLVHESSCQTDWMAAQQIFDQAMTWRVSKNSPDPLESILLIARKIHDSDPVAAFLIVSDLAQRFSDPKVKSALISYHLAVLDKLNAETCEMSFKAMAQICQPDQLDTNQRLAIMKTWNEIYLDRAPVDKSLSEFILSLSRCCTCREATFWTQRWQIVRVCGNAQEALKAWDEFLSLTGSKVLIGMGAEREECFAAALKALAACESKDLEPLLWNSKQQSAYRNLAPKSLESAYASFLLNIGTAACKTSSTSLKSILALLPTVSPTSEQLLILAEALLNSPESAFKQKGYKAAVDAVGTLNKGADPALVEQTLEAVLSLIVRAKDSVQPSEILMHQFVEAVARLDLSAVKKIDIAHRLCVPFNANMTMAATSLLSAAGSDLCTVNVLKVEQILSHVAPLAVLTPKKCLECIAKLASSNVDHPGFMNSLLEAYLNPLLALVHSSRDKKIQVKAFSAFAEALAVISKSHDIGLLKLSHDVPSTLELLARDYNDKNFLLNSLQPYLKTILALNSHNHKMRNQILLSLAKVFFDQSLLEENCDNFNFVTAAHHVLVKMGDLQGEYDSEELSQALKLCEGVMDRYLDRLKAPSKADPELQALHALLKVWKKHLDPLVTQTIESAWPQNDRSDSIYETLIVDLLKRDLKNEAKRGHTFQVFLSLISQLVKKEKYKTLERCLSLCASHVSMGLTEWNCQVVGRLVDALVACYASQPRWIKESKSQTHAENVQRILYEGVSYALDQGNITVDGFEAASKLMYEFSDYVLKLPKECWHRVFDPLVASIPGLSPIRPFIFPLVRFLVVLMRYARYDKSINNAFVLDFIEKIERQPGLFTTLAAETARSRTMLNGSRIPPKTNPNDLWITFLASMKDETQLDQPHLIDEIGWITNALLLRFGNCGEIIDSCLTLWMTRAATFLNMPKSPKIVDREAAELSQLVYFLLDQAPIKNHSEIARRWFAQLSKGNDAVQAEAANWHTIMQKFGWDVPVCKKR